jgi:hypothetical protein
VNGRFRVPAVLALAAAVATVFTALAVGINPRGLQVSAAATHIFVDTPSPSLLNRDAFPVSTLIRRAELLSQTAVTPPVLERISRDTKIPLDEIGSEARSTANVPFDLVQPGSEQRANDLSRIGKPYSVEAQARQSTPVVDVYARAPTTEEAVRLANAVTAALEAEIKESADRAGVPSAHRLTLRRMGPARGAVVSSGMPMAIAVLAFLLSGALTAAGLLYATRRQEDSKPTAVPPTDDPWPNTSRLLPWMFAGFLAVLWLVPFNDIELTVQLPVDLKFDRLILPFVFAVWAIGFMVGGRLAPRVRPTWIHAAVCTFVVCAFVSVILDSRYLNRTLELEGSVKQLPLLMAYVSLFLIASTAIRSNEVWPFLKYTLILAVICGLGVIFEYRFKQNFFYDMSGRLLPGFFSVPELDAGAVDNIGRRMARGPAAMPLETVAMLAMALPIALVSAMKAPEWRNRLLYALAACVLLAAALSTSRKSALLAPFAVVATIAYFRRRELLRLAPLGFILIIVVHIAAPGALGKTTTQFDPSRLGVSTVSDRAADYDAVRPDVWTHLVFGRGWGSYDWLTYRILDSELLHRTIEMGVVGLLSYIAMILSVIFSARRIIAGRDRRWAPMALMGAASAMSFLTVSLLFDVLAFPHATYIFLYMAGLTAVVVTQRGREPVVMLSEPHALRPESEPREPVPLAAATLT